MKRVFIITLIVLFAGLLLFRFTKTDIEEKPVENVFEPETIATELYVPWDIAELPDETILVTERDGHLTILRDRAKNRILIPDVREAGEGGLTGLTIHPKFEENNLVYFLHTTTKNGRTINRVTRYRFENDFLNNQKIVIDDIPGARNHNGGRIRFGPDGFLYITTGDASDESLAQNTGSLAGKILRIRDDGSIPSDNPFGNPVYSFGHRNPQGIAWDHEGRLWATEHGRSGFVSGYDEINLIVKGGNYGWPLHEGDETASGMIPPVLHSGPEDTWAPSGLAFLNGKLYFAGLRGQALYGISVLDNGTLSNLERHLHGEFGRLRGVTESNGQLYLTTSNRDGRGRAASEDDRLIILFRDSNSQ